MSSSAPPTDPQESRDLLAAEMLEAKRAFAYAELQHLRQRLSLAEEQARMFSSLATREQSLLEQFQESRLWVMTRRWRRFKREFLHGSLLEKRELVRALWRLVTRPITRRVLKHRRVGMASRSLSLIERAADRTEFLPAGRNANGPFAVLVFPAIAWQGRFQRPQQLTRQFAQAGRLTLYVSIDFIIAPRDLSYHEIASRIEICQIQDALYEVRLVATDNLAPTPAGPVIYRKSLEEADDLRYLRWSLRAVQEKLGYSTTISLVSLPFWGPLALSLPCNWVVYDCLDEHTGFVTNAAAMIANEAELIAQADLLVVTSHRLVERMQQAGRECELIPNGCDYEHFAVEQSQRPPELSSLSGPIIGYYGAIADWFDTRLVAEIARTRPEWNLVLIGNTRFADLLPFEGIRNIHLLGEKPYAELPGYAAHFEVSLIPFKINQLTLATNPVKVYEYFAMGKPVVATPLPEVKALGDLVRIASGAKAFVGAIEEALQDKDAETIIRRKEFARANTWRHRYEALIDAIRRRVVPRISALLVTYNKWEMTSECLASLLSESYYPDLEIVIVDNLSTDQTRDELEKLVAAPGFRIILNPRNMGFAAGCNLAARNATGEILVFLNNDTVVRRGWLRGLASRLLTANIGLVGPLTDAAGNDQTLGAFVEQSPQNATQDRIDLVLLNRKGRTRDKQELGFFCVAMRREVYQEVGPLDEKFSTGMFEDDDYCLRTLNAGYRLTVAEDVFIHHHRGASFSQLQQKERQALWDQNRRKFEQKHGQTWRRPAQPLQVRLRDLEASEMAQMLSDLGLPTMLVCPDADFWAPWGKAQQISRALARLGMMVFYWTRNQSHDSVNCFEEYDYNLLLTNDLRYFREVTFDWALTETGVQLPDWLHYKVRGELRLVQEGCDYEHFASPQTGPTSFRLQQILDLGQPIIGYTDDGWTSEHADALTKAALAMPNVSFIRIGPTREQQHEPANLHRIEWLSYADFPHFTQALSAAVIAPMAGTPRTVARIGAWDYLASGCCVITLGCEPPVAPGVFISDADRLAQDLGKAIQAGRNKHTRHEMAVYAQRNTWEERAREFTRGL